LKGSFEGLEAYRTGALLLGLGDFSQALKQFETALWCFEEEGDPCGQSLALAGLGETQQALGQGLKTIDLYQRAITLSDGCADRRLISVLNYNCGLHLRQLGRFEDAKACFEKARIHASDFGDSRGELLAQIAIEDLRLFAEPSVDPQRMLERALELAREVEDKNLILIALKRAASFYREHGRLDRSLELLEEALSLARSLSDVQEIGILANDLAGHYLENGDLTRARSLLYESLVITRQHEDPSGELEVLDNLVLVLEALGESGEIERMELRAARLRQHRGIRERTSKSI